MKRSVITLTNRATQRLQYILSKKPEYSNIRLGIKTQGCNGLSYTLNFENQEKKFDTKVNINDNGNGNNNSKTLLIDPKTLMYTMGTTIDYHEDELSSEFKFTNPNQTSTCGCGESFNVNLNKHFNNRNL